LRAFQKYNLSLNCTQDVLLLLLLLRCCLSKSKSCGSRNYRMPKGLGASGSAIATATAAAVEIMAKVIKTARGKNFANIDLRFVFSANTNNN